MDKIKIEDRISTPEHLPLLEKGNCNLGIDYSRRYQPLCLMTIVSRSQAAYKMRLEQPQAMFSFYQSSRPKLRKYANESFDIKQFLLSLATFFILKGCTPLLDDVTTENHAHPRFTGAYEPWGKNEIYTVVGTGQQRSQALHGGKINKIRLPIRSVFKLYPNGIVVN